MDDVYMPPASSEEQAISIALHHFTIAVSYYEAAGPKIYTAIAAMNAKTKGACFVEALAAWSEVLNRHFTACPYDDERKDRVSVN